MLTVVIPHIDRDAHLMERAAASVAAQTIPTVCIPVYDAGKKGPQWARNRGIEQAKTHFITFLDADDFIEPDFAEKMLRAYRPGHYVYSDCWKGASLLKFPDDTGWQVHATVTRVMRTETARAVGGFNETLRRLEDTEFWLRLRHRGICGIHVPEPLLHYTPGGARSSSHKDREQLLSEKDELFRRYNMGCCGGDGTPVHKPAGVQLENDVLAIANWGGNRTFIGRVTGRAYPRTGNGKTVWVDPLDLAAMKELLPTAEPVEPIVETPLDVEPASLAADADSEVVDFDSMTVAELRELAQRLGIDIGSRAKREEIIEAINAA